MAVPDVEGVLCLRMRLLLVLCAGLALTVGSATSTAGGGNSDAAKACQKGGWQNLVREDGSVFKNTGDCVSYAAQGGTLKPKSTCVAGSENFSDDVSLSQPTTFSGGTIDTAYGIAGGIYDDWGGGFTDGTHVLFSGIEVNSFRLTFTEAVGSVMLEAQSNTFAFTTDTLTAYDASNNVVDTDSALDPFNSSNTLTATSTSDNIRYFTIATNDPQVLGIAFSNIVWSCN